VVDAGRLDPGLLADLAEPRAPALAASLVQVETVADRLVSVGNPPSEPGIGAFTSV
jgi:hypothetical protein